MWSPPGGDRDRLAPGAQEHRRDCVRRLVVTDGRRAPQAEHAATAVAPAPHRSRPENHTGMEGAAGDRHCLAPGAQIDRHHCARELVVADRVDVPVPKPAQRPGPPAAHRARVQDHAGVGVTGGEPNRLPARSDADRPDRGRKLGVADRVGVPVSELTAVAHAPAANAALLHDDAGVREAGGQGKRTPAGAEIDEAHRARRLGIPDRGDVPVPEPPVGAESPAANAARVEDDAGVGVRRIDERGRHPALLRRSLLCVRRRRAGQHRSERQPQYEPHAVCRPSRRQCGI